VKPDVFVTAASVLFGFLFAGFWWTLNRELTFEPSQRHFKPSYGLLLFSMLLLAGFGVIAPLAKLAAEQPELRLTYRAMVLVIIGIFGYMLSELAHYSVFQRPKYVQKSEKLILWFTVVTLLALVGYWIVQSAA